MNSGESTGFTSSAFKHGITEEQVREVLIDADAEEFELGPDSNGDPCEMVVGSDSNGNIIEVGICY